MNTKRAYTMTARAEAAEATRTRILQAVVDLTSERLLADIALDDVAAQAGVSVQTVLRRFGSRAGLLEDAVTWQRAAVTEERRTPVGDLRLAVSTITEHYERRGDGVLLMLAQEQSEEHLRRVVEEGRRMHREWVTDVFAPYVAQRPAAQHEALVDLLVVATDVYTWKLLRRDRGLSRAQTQRRVTDLVTAVLATTPKEG